MIVVPVPAVLVHYGRSCSYCPYFVMLSSVTAPDGRPCFCCPCSLWSFLFILSLLDMVSPVTAHDGRSYISNVILMVVFSVPAVPAHDGSPVLLIRFQGCCLKFLN